MGSLKIFLIVTKLFYHFPPFSPHSQDSNNPHDEGRHFILSYFLASNMISIFEKPTRNSGIMAGKFLEKTRVPKPGFEADKPLFYSPADLAIGATVVGEGRPHNHRPLVAGGLPLERKLHPHAHAVLDQLNVD